MVYIELEYIFAVCTRLSFTCLEKNVKFLVKILSLMIRMFAMKELRGRFLRGISTEKVANFVPI